MMAQAVSIIKGRHHLLDLGTDGGYIETDL